MRIAFLSVGDTARLTGGYLYHREVFARLRARGVTVDEITAAPAGLAEQLAAAEAFTARFEPRPYDAVVVDALARAVCGPGLDRWRAARPLVAMIHELPSVAAGASDEAEAAREAPLLRADAIIAVSDDGARILAGRGAPPEHIVVASGGLNRLSPPPPRVPVSPRPPLPLSPRLPHSSPPLLTVLCVAQWIPRKGVLELARAWSGAARPGWRLELVGETDAGGAYGERVREALAPAPAGSVAVLGAIPDAELADAYRRASLFALPARYEGYGIAFAEALAHGLPVVGCAAGPVPALVGLEAGVLVPPGDEAALAAALGRLMDDGDRRERMSRAALARAAELPTWEACAERFLSAVEAAIRRRSGPGA